MLTYYAWQGSIVAPSSCSRSCGMQRSILWQLAGCRLDPRTCTFLLRLHAREIMHISDGTQKYNPSGFLTDLYVIKRDFGIF